MLRCFYETKWTKNYIDENGEVWSQTIRKKNKQLKKLKPTFNKHRGYYYVATSLCDGKGGRKNWAVHRLVAQAFVSNPNNLTVVNHIDGDKTNNSASNLEWTTPAGNVKHAQKNGLLTSQRGWYKKYTQRDYDRWKKDYERGIKYREIAKKYNVPESTIWFAVHGKRGK